MATDPKFVDFILDQLQGLGPIIGKKMFGEYGLYAGDTLFALVCDNKLFVKPTIAGRAFLQQVVEAAPYPGAKPSFLIAEGVEDRQWLQQLVRLTVAELPPPKAKKPKQKPL
ncbi:TfoX/Sxy family protein [Hymenobacter sp. HDW8]|uniref:TfoX/Sxy family protein n=1 Tax=Hymenobacter sp. HDW8 TaxID=2714932 RepID=UPI00140BBF25|nr:TfoX/Sxy family protein [Hymenobacter sp. HDW8]QIL78347.1 TfoX/Sxy family protein [Hymenobacter sp. HDW8]